MHFLMLIDVNLSFDLLNQVIQNLKKLTTTTNLDKQMLQKFCCIEDDLEQLSNGGKI